MGHIGWLVHPHVVDGREQFEELRFGEIGTAVERFTGRGEEHRHRPTAPARHRLYSVHVHGVDVGPLFAVDLHVHEPLVHGRSHLGVFEAFVRHHMAPVAGRIADAQQDGPVDAAGLLEGLGAPGVPVDGVVPMLAEIGRRLGGEAVHALRLRARVQAPTA